jgi:hypothetical protein
MNIKVIVCTKNEYDLIESFIVFYGSLFGYNNLIIIDNGSVDLNVLNIYEKYKNLGIVIEIDNRPFTEIINIMNDYINKWKDTCDWMFLLETDEFLFWYNTVFDKNSIINKTDIIKLLEDQEEDVSVIRFGHVWNSIVDNTDIDYISNKYTSPPTQMTKFKKLNWEKNIIRTSKFNKITLWSHWIEPIDGKTICCNEIGLLHYHNTGSRRYYERNLNLINGYRYFDLNLDTYIQIPVCEFLIKMGVNSHHRLEEYLKFLYRKFVIEKFALFIHRLPNESEIDEILMINNTNNIIINILENRIKYTNTSLNHNLNAEELLFYEKNKEYDYNIYQVKNYLNYLDILRCQK